MDNKTKLSAILTPEQVAALTTQSPQMPLMYFNYSRTAASFYDLRLFFGQGHISAQGQQGFVEQLCVVMSIEFARTLRDNLTTTIDMYEEAFGKLRTEPVVPVPQSQVPSPPPASGSKNGGKKKSKPR